MKKKITRRHFINGTKVAIGVTLLSPWMTACGVSDPFPFGLDKDYYPPALNGLRGSHDGSWEVMHERVTGKEWQATTIDDEYDLVIVGGGISGLASG